MKTINQAVGIKIILIAVITIVGISLFSAFKQSEGSKKYLNMTVRYKEVYIIDENGVVNEKKLSGEIDDLQGSVDITKEINSISAKGYKLISSNTKKLTSGYSVNQYIFEKE